MKKIISLIKACMTDNMKIFNIKNKNRIKSSKKIIPIFLVIAIFFSIWSYANMLMEPLAKANAEYVALTLFVLFTTVLTLMEGIFKTGSLLFNCKDDNLMFSLPIKRTTVLFIRIFKFYVFELLYNTIFLLPAMVVYIRYVNVNYTFYLVSLLAILFLPIIPIVISCVLGAISSGTSSKFKYKNIIQILITTLFLLGILYISFNLQNIIKDIAKNATSINDIITKLYYPAGAYIKLITNFNIKDLIIFVLIHLGIFVAFILLVGKLYFKINSKVKAVKIIRKKSNYKIKTNKPISALIKKEFKKFLSSPVFVINAGFGLVMYIVGCVLITVKMESIVQTLSSQGINILVQDLKEYLPLIQFGLVCFASLMSSITCSMISLEGKTFNILKSLPLNPYKIIMSKVYTAVIIMIPVILIGDLVMFLKFKFNILEILMILLASIILPLLSETFGIIINLKYPKMNGENDTEIVKQSMSSFVAVFGGIVLLGITIYLIVKAINLNFQIDLIILSILVIYILIYLILMTYLKKKGVKEFNSINV